DCEQLRGLAHNAPRPQRNSRCPGSRASRLSIDEAPPPEALPHAPRQIEGHARLRATLRHACLPFGAHPPARQALPSSKSCCRSHTTHPFLLAAQRHLPRHVRDATTPTLSRLWGTPPSPANAPPD